MAPQAWDYRRAEDHVLGLEQFGMRFGLERIGALLAELGDPQNSFESIHVVGSNGKSSTVRMSAAILAAHGVRTGAYLSPHLRGYNERVRIAGEDSSQPDFARAVQRAGRAAKAIEAGREPDDLVTQFETLTAAAFLLFERAQVEVAVIEAGLGGRHDATNVLERSRVQVLTNVALEHTEWLGDTITAIAEEKAAVIRPRATAVIGPELHPDALAVVKRICDQRVARLEVAAGDAGVELAAGGGYQRRNFALARAAAAAQIGELDETAVSSAASVVTVPGRFEIRHAQDGGATVVLDGAHNSHGALELAQALQATFTGRRVVGVLAILQDKDAEDMVAALVGCFDAVVCTTNSNPRALPADRLAAIVAAHGREAVVVADPRAALARGCELAGAGGVAVATGSLYLLADLEREPGGRVSTL